MSALRVAAIVVALVVVLDAVALLTLVVVRRRAARRRLGQERPAPSVGDADDHRPEESQPTGS